MNEVRRMSEDKTHPSIQRFKQFVKKHPGLIYEVRKGKGTWQEYYEEWYLLGEDDPKWEKYKTKLSDKREGKEKKSEQKLANELLNQLLTYLKSLDVNQLQQYLNQLSETIESLQKFVSQMNENNHQKHSNPRSDNRKLFMFRND